MKTGDFFHTERQKRVLAMDECLRLPGGMTRQQICKRLKQQGFAVSQRNFMRDIDYLRHELKAPVGHIYRATGFASNKEPYWLYRDAAWTLGQIRLTEGTLLALLVARRVVEQYAGMPIAEELKKAYDQLAESLNRKVSVRHDALTSISFSQDAPEEINTTVWDAILKATIGHRVLRIEYAKGWDPVPSKPKITIVRPYHIVNLQGNWYLLGSADDDRKTVKQYAVRRIRSAAVLNETFEVPNDFDIKMVMDNTFGRFIGDPSKTVDLQMRFASRVAPLIMERRFHPKEHKVVEADGRILVSFPVTSSGSWPFYHVIGWILSWGSDAEVIGPPEVRQMVSETSRQTLAKYV